MLSDSFDSWLQSEMERLHIPGLAAAIVLGDRPVYITRGLANVEHNVPVTLNSPFEIASLTKTFTAAAILLLSHRNKLDLHQPIGTLLDGLPEHWHAITPHQVLRHSTGLPNYVGAEGYWEDTRTDRTPSQILDLVRDHPLAFTPGQRQMYDNTGYYLLGLLIEEITQQTYGDYLREQFFEPLGMQHTRANHYRGIVPGRVAGYTGPLNKLENSDYYSISNTYSGGVLISSIADFVRWDLALTNGTALPEVVRSQMWTPHPSAEANEREFHFTMTLGWFVVDLSDGRQFYGHNGHKLGFGASYMRFHDEKMSLILFLNTDMVNESHKLAIDIGNRVRSQYLD